MIEHCILWVKLPDQDSFWLQTKITNKNSSMYKTFKMEWTDSKWLNNFLTHWSLNISFQNDWSFFNLLNLNDILFASIRQINIDIS